MVQFLAHYMPWLLSAITIVATELLGRKWRWAWAISLGNQALWLVWIAASSNWGFLPLTFILSIQYLRNHVRWAPAVVRAWKPCSDCAWDDCAKEGCFLAGLEPARSRQARRSAPGRGEG
jgi:hypothetical protein